MNVSNQENMPAAISTESKIPVVVVGARGYSGLELSRLLLKHESAQLIACFATKGFRLDDYLTESSAARIPCHETEQLLPMAQKGQFKVAFLATPLEVSADLAPKLMELGVHVIDLSGAFRLQAGDQSQQLETYKNWYRIEHPAAALIKRAEYGLVPWTKSTVSLNAKEPVLVSNPGCFATAVLMGLLPLLEQKLIDPETIVVDAKSGTTGAGKKAEERLLHAEVQGLCLPYRIGAHQHDPEIRQFAERFGGAKIDMHFTTHLLDTRRGIIAGLYLRPSGVLKGKSSEEAESMIQSAFERAYSEDRLVRFGPLRTQEAALLSLRRVVGSARTHIGYKMTEDKLYVFAMIDNLMKGAASQAVENFNRLIGAPNWMSLTDVEGLL